MQGTRARAALLAAAVVALATAGSAVAQENETRDRPEPGRQPRRGAPGRARPRRYELQLKAEDYGIDFNDHYLRHERERHVTVTVFGSDGRARTRSTRPATSSADDRGPRHVARPRSRTGRRTCKAEKTARGRRARRARAEVRRRRTSIVVLRVDYFENYAGRFLSVEAKDRLGGTRGSTYSAPTLSALLEHRGGHADRPGPADDERQHRPGHDARHVHRAPRSSCGSATPAADAAARRRRSGSARAPARRRGRRQHLARRRPAADELELPAATSRRGTWTRPRSTQRFDELAAEFPNIAEMIPLPYKTNGYQRQGAGDMMAGTDGTPAVTGSLRGRRPAPGRRPHVARLGPRGRQRHHGRVRQPGRRRTRRSPSRSIGNDIVVSLATDATGVLTSTAAQVVGGDQRQSGAPRALVKALTYRGNAGAGIVQAAAEGEPVRLPDDGDERARRSAGRSSTPSCGSASGATASTSASSSTASSTPASGRRR